ncbi:MAG: class I SAM-dependent rRNA methyltransferase [Candidatus Omnitrophica bacterium]|nr:class I SAM-dependent rRNA methyltransferase [Candidatus Omnitrophota bacterium]
MYPIVLLKKGREKSIARRHPWIFSGAVQRADAPAAAGGLVCVESEKQLPLATGYYNPQSDIRVRILDFKESKIDEGFFTERFKRAWDSRKNLLGAETDAWRLINSEGDGLPGLVVDRYADGLVVSVETLGMERLKPLWLKALEDAVKPQFIFERSERDERESDRGSKPVRALLSGEREAGRVVIREGGCRYLVDFEKGQKTGFYLDQREGRRWVGRLAKDRRVLNLFSYSGGFTVQALKEGAREVVSVDSSRPALELLEENLALNGLDSASSDAVEGNVFDFLRTEKAGEFGLVIVDPPSFARRRSETQKAGRAYKDVNRLAFQRAAPGGYVLTYSCSHFFPYELFIKIVYQAALEAGREARILNRFSHPVDHPVHIFHPEGEYFKGLLLEVS